MSRNKLWLLIAIVAIGLIGTASLAFASHTDPITLKDHDGNVIQGGTSVPYSPKQTCGGCHNYESNVAHATKDHGPGTTTYSVPYPRSGVSAGFHSHQGRNTSWGDTQRNYYGLQSFTMSGGMYGKY